MSISKSFRSRLSKRILALVTVTLPAGVMATQGCTELPTCSEDTRDNQCFAWPANEGANGGAGGMSGGGAGGLGSGDAGAAGMGGAAGHGGTGGAAPVMCPSRDTAKTILNSTQYYVSAVVSDGVLANGQCCYDIQRMSMCGVGRPFLVDETPRTAMAETQSHGGAWSDAEKPKPDVQALTNEERTELAAAWARDGLFEHASVASFGRFALELIAVGAPPQLISDAHKAALDEVRHARLCLSLASGYAGHVIEPGVFPFDGRVAVSADLAEIASRVAREGAIGETIAAAIAAEQLLHAKDPAVRAALSVIAEDEARHAELAFRTLMWAIQVGGDCVAEAIGRTFDDALRGYELPEPASSAVFEAHGRLGEERLRQAAKGAIDDVLLPAITALGLGRKGRFSHSHAHA